MRFRFSRGNAIITRTCHLYKIPKITSTIQVKKIKEKYNWTNEVQTGVL